MNKDETDLLKLKSFFSYFFKLVNQSLFFPLFLKQIIKNKWKQFKTTKKYFLKNMLSNFKNRKKENNFLIIKNFFFVLENIKAFLKTIVKQSYIFSTLSTS